MRLKECLKFSDFRKLAKKNLPSPIFHYIDGGADDAWDIRLAANLFVPFRKPFLGHLDSLINKEALAELAVVRHLPVEAALVEPVGSLLVCYLANVEELVQGAGERSQ